MTNPKNRRIWVDVLTPKQALFTKAMVERCPSDSELVLTTRDYSELNKFLKQIKLDCTSFGRHGGALQINKLKASVERMKELVPFIEENDFDCSLSFISPEAARVSFGLALDHFICSDSPHANAASRLAVPLAKSLFSPFPLSKRNWSQYGVNPSQIFFYHALDPWAWLISNVEHNENVPRQDSRVVIRLEESFASYQKLGKGVSEVLPSLIKMIKSKGDFEIVLIPRYDDQRMWAKKEFALACIIPDSVVDGLDLIKRSDLLIGGGGTMTQEAALIGVPNISYFPSTTLDVFENYYFPKRLSIKASTRQELIMETRKVLSQIDTIKGEFKARARNATKTFEDPVRFIFERMSQLSSRTKGRAQK